MRNTSTLSELDGRPYDPDDADQQYCLKKAKCYVDRTVDPPVIRYIKSDGDYEIVGWVWLTKTGVLKSYGVDVKLTDDGKAFIYRGRKFPPGVYYLVRRDGRESLVSEAFLKSL